MDRPQSMEDEFLEKIDQIIEDNYTDERFSVEDMARKAGLSRSNLFRKLRKLTGQTASQLITRKRLNRAKELLENNAGTVSEISYRVGFGSPTYFNTVFN